MIVSKTELLGLLTSLGVEYPSDTKLSHATLERRLLRALDCAQSLSTAVPKLPLDPASLATWKTPSKRSLSHVVQRNNLSGTFFPTQFSSDGAEAFDGLCQAIMQLAKYFDDGFRLVFAMDEEGTSAICLKNIEVRKIDDDTPVFMVMYSRKTSREDVRLWAESHRSLVADFRVPEIRAGRAQQQLFSRILAENSYRISKAYTPARNPTEDGFRTSFLLPVGPLRAEDLGALNRDPGCAVCGKKTTSRCSRCAVVSYCGIACQTEDWASHKTFCKSLSGGTWKTVKVVLAPFDSRFVSIVNRHTQVRDITKTPNTESTSAPPLNKHGTKPFVVKLQNNSAAGPSGAAGFGGVMTLIYDRQRTFQVYSTRSADKEGFEALLPVIAKGYMGMKVFCWARRVSDWELNICLDRLPDQDIKW